MKTVTALMMSFSSVFSSPLPVPQEPALASHPNGGTSYVGSRTVWGFPRTKISKREAEEGFGTLQDEVEEAIGKVRDLEEPAFAFDRDAEAAVNEFVAKVADLEETKFSAGS